MSRPPSHKSRDESSRSRGDLAHDPTRTPSGGAGGLAHDPTRTPSGDASDLAHDPTRTPSGGSTVPAPGTEGAPAASVARESPGRYHIRSILGQGGQSRVFLAHDNVLGRDIALKQPIASGDPAAPPEAALARFLREARITARLEHPNIVPVYEIGVRPDGSYYCAQRLVGDPDSPPRTLRRALEDAGGLDDRLALLPHFVAVCNAMAFAHEHGVVHRDLKPDNVVVGRLGETVVLDWGLAKVVGEEDTPGDVPARRSTVETVVGAAFGTPAYMSPEQAAGKLALIDARSDVWSLGAILYEILTGRPPYASATVATTIERVLEARAAPVRDLRPEAPPALAAVAEKATARDRAGRYAGATELAADIEAFQENARVGVYRYSALELVRLFVRRHRALVTVAAVAAALVASAAVVAGLQFVEAREYLARALVEKGRRAQTNLQWDRAAAYYAAARTYDDLPAARWGARLSENLADAPITRFAAHDEAIHSLAFTADGTLVSASDGGRIKIWDTERRRPVEDIDTGTTIYTAAVTADGEWIATGSQRGQLSMWSAGGGRETALHRHSDSIFDVAFSPNGRRIAAGTADYRVLVYDLDEDRITANVALPGVPVYGVAFRGGEVVAAGHDGHIHRVDPASGAVRSGWQAHADAVLAVAVSPKGTRIATTGRDSLVKLWRPEGGEPIRRLTGHTQKVYAAAFSPDGSLLATGGTDKTLRLWDVATGRPIVSRSLGHGQPVGAIAFSPDGNNLAWAGEGEIWLRRLPAREYRKSVKQRVAISPDDDRALIRWPGGRAGIVSLPDLEDVRTISGFGYGWPLSWVGDAIAVSCGRRGPMCLHDVERNEMRSRWDIRTGGGAILDVALRPNARQVAVARQDGTIGVWNAASGGLVRELRGHPDSVHDVTFSPDGDTLATAGYEGTAALWDASTWDERARLRGHTRGVNRVAFSPDGRLVATASWDQTVRLWRADTGEPVDVLRGHEGHVRGVDFGPRGDILVSGGRDGTLRFWDVSRAEQLGVYAADEASVEDVLFACDGRCVVSSGHRAHILQLPPIRSPEDQLARILDRSGLEIDGIELSRKPAPSLRDTRPPKSGSP